MKGSRRGSENSGWEEGKRKLESGEEGEEKVLPKS